MFLYQAREAVAVAEKLNAALTANDTINNVTNQAWNSIVGVNFTSQTKVASQVNNMPKGLLKIVADPAEQIKASPLPSRDYLLSKSFYIKGKHEITSSHIRKIYGQKVLDVFASGANLESQEAKSILESKSYAETLSEEVENCINNLQGQFMHTIGKIAGDALGGSVTLEGDNVDQTFVFEKVEVAAASPFWSDIANATPFEDMIRVNDDLRALANNQFNGLRFGSTVIGESALGYLIQNPVIRNAITAQLNTNALVSVANIQGYIDTYAIPTFGQLKVDYKTNYIDASNQPQDIIDPRYVYSASNTALQTPPNGIPNTPIVLSVVPADLTGLPVGGVQSSNRTGASVRIIRVEPREDGEELKWQIIGVAKIIIMQYRPFARMQILTV